MTEQRFIVTETEAAAVEGLLTTAKVAALLDVPVSTVVRWRGTGYGPRSILVGKHRNPLTSNTNNPQASSFKEERAWARTSPTSASTPTGSSAN